MWNSNFCLCHFLIFQKGCKSLRPKFPTLCVFTFEEKLKYIHSDNTYIWLDFLISDWCAKYYQHSDFNGWEKVVGETSQLDLTGNENDQASSVRVRPSCTLTLFEDHNNVGLLDSLTADVSLLSYNDQVSSVSCTCQGMREKI